MLTCSALLCISALIACSAWLYFFFTRKYSHWSSMGVGGPPPYWLVGNIGNQMNKIFFHHFQLMVRQYGEVYGGYMGWKPSLTVADPVLVKQILVKDFHHFIDRINPKAYHELWNKNLFTANGEDWKKIRSITSPTFSSGKLREMNGMMQKCILNLDHYFARIIEQSEDDSGAVIQTKSTFAGFTIDVIASTAFATDTNANMEGSNAFVQNGRALFEIKAMRAMASFLLPTWLLKFIGIETIFPKENFDFFVALSKRMLEQRLAEIKLHKADAPKRNDLLQMLIDAAVDESELTSINYDKMTVTEDTELPTGDQVLKKESKSGSSKWSEKKKLSTSEIIANCILFFAAGYETTSAALSHCIYELAKNEHIQERLSSELTAVLDPFGEAADASSDEYLSAVNSGIPYLEAVIKETLRRYSPLALVGRVCNAEEIYTLKHEGRSIHLQKGDIISLPIVAIHMNHKYYPQPTLFDPERFMPENKHKLVPYTYLPFADGPRNCIAMRMAYQEIKLCLAHLLTRYRFTTTPETPEELTFKPNSALLIAEEFPIRVSRR